jgi:CBS domain-containing protein
VKVRELMTKDVQALGPDAPVTQAAQLMASVNCGSLPIVSGNQLVGIVTDRDIVLRVVAQGKDVNTATCADCMTNPVTTASPDMDAHQAADLMAQQQIRRLPVVENGSLVGMVALGDLATVNIHVNEAGEALSAISEPSLPEAH